MLHAKSSLFPRLASVPAVIGWIAIVCLTLSLTAPPTGAADGSANAASAASVEQMKAYTEKVPGAEIEFDMVPIPAGADGYPDTFTMGSPASEAGRKDDEGPPIKVQVEPFWIAKHETIWDHYNEFRSEYEKYSSQRLKWPRDKDKWADAVSIPTPLWDQDSAPILKGMGTKGGYPVADISQYSARQFTKWLSKRTGHFYRLPTEAEWEYAARAGADSAYAYGDDAGQLGDYGWFFDNSGYEEFDKGHPEFGAGYRKVGEKKPNAWGVHDMHGNVSEWVIDQYDPAHYKKLAGKTVSAKDATNWPTLHYPRVARGGNWLSDPEACRSAARLASTGEWSTRDPQIPKSIWWHTDAFHVGFRIIRPLREPGEAEKLRYWEADSDEMKIVQEKGEKEVRALLDVKPGE